MWQPTSNSTVMGRIRHKNPIIDTIVGQHYIEWLDHNTNTPTPHSSSPILIQYTGCHLDDPSILLPRTFRATCLFSDNANLTMIIDQSNVRLSNNKIQLVHQLPDLSELSYSHFEFMTSTMLIKRPIQPQPASGPSHLLSQQLISRFIVQGSYQSKLATLASQLSDYNTVNFYTDGSLSHGGSTRMTMSIGWTTTFDNVDNLTFHAAISGNPSSTKAEIIAILTALITCPAHAIVNIYTDSQCCVDYFDRLKHTSSNALRYKKSLYPNYLHWDIILEIILTLSLHVSLFKIQGHSNNHFNDIADNLANTDRHLYILNTYVPQLTYWTCHFSWSDYLIEQPLRPFLKSIFKAYNFNQWT